MSTYLNDKTEAVCQARKAKGLPEEGDTIDFLLVNNVPDEILVDAQADRIMFLVNKIQTFKASQNKAIKKEDKRPEVSSFIDQGILYEEIIDQGVAHFVGWNKDYVCWYDDDKYLPLFNDAITKGAVLLPGQPVDYGTEEELIAEIRQHIHKYLDVGPEFEEYAIYYVLLSWVYDKLNTVPYLRTQGDYGTGKSRFIDTIGRICYKPIVITGAVTPAPIYRLIEQWHGTLLIDEADREKSDETNEIIKILNCGFERGRPVVRCNKENIDNIEMFDVYGPKVIGTRYSFFDKALESRCITYIMQATRRQDIPPLLLAKFHKSEQNLRNKLLMFRLRHYPTIDAEQLEDFMTKGFEGIEPRLKQASAPFMVLFANDGVRNKFLDFTFKRQEQLIEERGESTEGQIVNAIKEFRDKGQEQITANDLKEAINEGLSEKEKTNTKRIGHIMRSLGILSVPTKTLGTTGGKTKRLLVLPEEQLPQMYARYNVDYWKGTLQNRGTQESEQNRGTQEIQPQVENLTNISEDKISEISLYKENERTNINESGSKVTEVTTVTGDRCEGLNQHIISISETPRDNIILMKPEDPPSAHRGVTDVTTVTEPKTTQILTHSDSVAIRQQLAHLLLEVWENANITELYKAFDAEQRPTVRTLLQDWWDTGLIATNKDGTVSATYKLTPANINGLVK